MVAPVKLVCSLAGFIRSFRRSFFLQVIWRLSGVSSSIMQLLDWKPFFLFARSCIAVNVDRTELALAVTESRLMLPAPLSTWCAYSADSGGCASHGKLMARMVKLRGLTPLLPERVAPRVKKSAFLRTSAVSAKISSAYVPFRT